MQPKKTGYQLYDRPLEHGHPKARHPAGPTWVDWAHLRQRQMVHAARDDRTVGRDAKRKAIHTDRARPRVILTDQAEIGSEAKGGRCTKDDLVHATKQ